MFDYKRVSCARARKEIERKKGKETGKGRKQRKRESKEEWPRCRARKEIERKKGTGTGKGTSERKSLLDPAPG